MAQLCYLYKKVNLPHLLGKASNAIPAKLPESPDSTVADN